MTFLKSQLEYFCNQAELHATLDHCVLGLRTFVLEEFGCNVPDYISSLDSEKYNRKM